MYILSLSSIKNKHYDNTKQPQILIGIITLSLPYHYLINTWSIPGQYLFVFHKS